MDILNTLLISAQNKSPENACEAVKKLSRICKDNFKADDKDTFILELFNKTNGILMFIQLANSEMKIFEDALKEALDLITVIYMNFTKELESYCKDIITACRSFVVSGNASAVLKNKSLELLFDIVDNQKEDANFPEFLSLYKTCKSFLQYPFAKTVLGNLFKIVGLYSRKYPHIIEDPYELRNMVMSQISKTLESSEKAYMEGCFQCLSDLLYNFPFEAESPGKQKLYEIMKQFALTTDKISHRNVLDVLQKHLYIMDDLLYQDLRIWLSKLGELLSGRNAEDMKLAFKTLEAVYKAANTQIAQRTDDEARETLRFIVEEFCEAIFKKKTFGYKLRLAIIGLGLFGDSYKAHFTNSEIIDLYTKLLHKVQHLYLEDKEAILRYITYLPNFIQSLSHLVTLIEISSAHVESLQELTILSFHIFPRLSTMHHWIVVNAVLVTCLRLYQTDPLYFNRYITTVAYQGVIQACIHKTTAEADIEDGVKITTYKTFIPLWQQLLTQKFNPEKYNSTDKEIQYVQKTMFDELVKTLLILVTKLNLKTKLRNLDIVSLDPNVMYEAEKLKDMDIFVNIIDFFIDIFEFVDYKLFKPWIHSYTNNIVRLSLKNPLVSGFYKLLCISLRFGIKLGIFSDEKMVNVENKMIFDTLKKFMQHLMSNIKSYKEDLQVSCLLVLLESPPQLLDDIWQAMPLIMVSTFTIGQSYLKLASTGIEALDKWVDIVPIHKLEPTLKEVLPILDYYLRSNYSLGGVTTDKLLLNKRITKQKASKIKLYIEEEPELLNIKRNILLFVSKLSAEYCEMMVNFENKKEPLIWTKTKHIKVPLTFVDVTFDLYLDKMVPRIIDVALHCSERKTRSIACELLHSVVIIVIGKQLPENNKNDLDNVFEKIIDAILKLCCTLDQTIKDMFCPLIKQLIHWYTHSSKITSSHTEILLHCILEGTCHPRDTAIKETSGLCLYEFVKYTMKQNYRGDLSSIDRILEKVEMYCLHPETNKRLGATIIFNNIYKEIRENDKIINKHCLYLLYTFVVNLSKAKYEDSNSNYIYQITAAIDHVVRILIEKSHIFDKESIDRILPQQFEGGTLKNIITWIAQQTSSLNPHLREKAMDIFIKLNQKDKNATEKYLKQRILPKIDENSEEFKTVDDVIHWLEKSLCLVDNLRFVEDVNRCAGANINIETTVILTAFLCYFNKAHYSLKEFKAKVSKNADLSWNYMDKIYFDHLRSTLALKIVEYFINPLKNGVILKQILHKEEFLFFTSKILFNLSSLGFELDELDNHRTTVLEYVQFLISNIDEKNITKFFGPCRTLVENSLSGSILETKGFQMQREVIEGLKVLKNTEIYSIVLSEDIRNKIIINVFKDLVEEKNGNLHIRNLSKSASEIADSKIELGLLTECNFEILRKFLFSSKMLKDVNISLGVYTFTKFKSTILEFISKQSCDFLNATLTECDSQLSMFFLCEIIDDMLAKKLSQQNCLEASKFVSDLLLKWELVDSYLNQLAVDTMADKYKKKFGFWSKVVFLDTNLSKDFVGNNSKFISYLQDMVDNKEQNLLDDLLYLEELLKLLCCIGAATDDFGKKIRSIMEYLRINYFVKSANNVPLETKALLLSSLFKNLTVLKSPIVLNIVTTIYTYIEQEINLNFSEKMENYIKVCDNDKQKKSVEEVFKYCIDTNLKWNQRYKLCRDILIPMINYTNQEVFEVFFVQIVPQLKTQLEKQELNKETLIEKTISFMLVDALFDKIDTDKMDNETCPMVKSYGGNADKKMFITNFIKYCLNTRNVSCPKEELKDIYHLFQCHSFNAFMSVVMNTVTAEQFYRKLFDPSYLSNIIDLDKKHVFTISFDEIPKRRKFLAGVQREIKSKYKSFGSGTQSLQYPESQNIFDSTLKDDISRYDFTFSAVRSQIPEQEIISSEKTEIVASIIELENVDFNTHICMPKVCQVFMEMVKKNILTISMEDSVMELPKIMNDFSLLLSNPATHTNVKLFLLKVIDNNKHIFQPYSKWFVEDIMNVITSGCAGNTVNYYVADLILLLISWHDPSMTYSKSTVTKTLQFLMEFTTTDRKDIFKYHLDLIKRFIEAFKSSIEIPCDLILKKLTEESTWELGVNLIVICLVNHVAPWPMDKESQKTFMALLKLLAKEKIQQPTCEAIGMVLRYMDKKPDYQKCLEQFLPRIQKVISGMVDNKKIRSIEKISKFYPPIIKDHVAYLIGQLPLLSSNHNFVIRALLANVEETAKSPSIFLLDISLKHDNEYTQILLIELILKVLHAEKIDLIKIVKYLSNAIDDKNPIVRSLVFDALIEVYKLSKDRSDDVGINLLKECTESLIKGLADPEFEIEEKLLHFWSEENNLPLALHQRFLDVLKNLYLPSTEDSFLGYSTYIMMNLLSKNQSYNEQIYNYSLMNCEFQDYIPNSNWKQRYSSMTPMFTSSQSVNQSQSYGSFNPNLIRATQDNLQFTPTVRTLQDEKNEQVNSSTSSLMVDVGSVFKNPNDIQMNKKYKSYNRRFLEDTTQEARKFAYYEVSKSEKKQNIRKESVKKNESTITLYRKYRDGEVPDIRIPLSEVLKPLQMLCKNDAFIAKFVFKEMFKGLLARQDDNEGFLSCSQKMIHDIFTNSENYSSGLMSTLLEISLLQASSFTFSTNLIAKVSEQSGLYTIGSYLLEEYLNNPQEENEEHVTKKARTNLEDETTNTWIKLAGLYKEMGEWDVVNAIFSKMIGCSNVVVEALTSESEENWKKAAKSYTEALEIDLSLDRKDFYYESLFKCFANLTEWENLSKSIKNTTNSTDKKDVWEKLWNDSWSKRKLLPWYIKSEIRNIINDSEARHDFLEAMKEFLMDPNKKDHLKQEFSEELSFLYFVENEPEMCKVYLKNYTKNFLEAWPNISVQYDSVRKEKLLNMQNTVEMFKLLEIAENYNEEYWRNIWKSDFNVSNTSVILNETRTFYRNEFINLLQFKYPQLKLQNVKFDLYYKLAEYAHEIQQFYLMRECYKKMKSAITSDDLKDNYITKLVLSRNVLLKYQHGEIEPEPIVKSWVKIDPKSNSVLNNEPWLMLLAKNNIFQITSLLYLNINEETLQETFSLIKHHLGLKQLQSKEALGLFGVTELANALQESASSKTNEARKVSYMGDCYLKLAYFMKNNFANNEELFIKFVLKAIYYGNLESRILFPCLLKCKSISTENKLLFENEIANIPIWIFLKWIPQILASLNSPATDVVSKIAINLVNLYPQAVLYPYLLTIEKTEFRNNPTVNMVQDRLGPLLTIVDDLLKAISNVALPNVILSYHLKILDNHVNSPTEFKNKLKEISEEIFAENTSKMRGNFYRKFNGLKKNFQQLTPKTYSNQRQKFLTDLRLTTREMQNIILSDFCPWLLDFHKLDYELEIPGQYKGDKKPLPQYHVKIFTFAQKLKLFHSLRHPVKISILGSDAKEYPFIVKYGEDLRQDERIEQIFDLMNGIYISDPACRKRKLKLQTYKVIPLSSKLGLIELISGVEISKFLTDNINDLNLIRLREIYTKFYKIIDNNAKLYHKAMEKYNENDIVANYRHMVNLVPQNALKMCFSKVSLNIESFVYLRRNFAQSYATNCISGWVLGIGDRHLSNTLLSLSNGEVTGIDFGHSFGSATEILALPEIVPIRLTPQFVSLLAPCKEHGLYEESMIHCLRALRKNSDPLLATMNVFLEDPSLDWINVAKKKLKSSSSSSVWWPLKKLNLAKDKLHGKNPVCITVEELKSNSYLAENKNLLDIYIKIVKGNPNTSIRALEDDDDLSAEKQVRCLIDQAMDNNLLGRMYHGWEPWI